jgi:hypothetical protein
VTHTFRAICRPLQVLLAGIALCLTCACSSNSGQLRLVSLDEKRNFSQTFSRAYISQSPSGDADIVMVEDGTDVQSNDSRKPLEPNSRDLPRQLVHVRVFWTPIPGTKADHPANTNASIHWCILGVDSRQSDMLEYAGSGLVEVSRSGSDATINIRNAWMKAATEHGNMTDPVGPGNLQGTIHAVADTAQVQAILAEIKSASGSSAEARAVSEAPSLQPQRLSVNP